MGPCCTCPLLLRDLVDSSPRDKTPAIQSREPCEEGASLRPATPLAPGTVAPSVCPIPWAAQAGS